MSHRPTLSCVCRTPKWRMQPHLIWRTWITPVCDLSSHRLMLDPHPTTARKAAPHTSGFLHQNSTELSKLSPWALVLPRKRHGPWTGTLANTLDLHANIKTDLSSLTPSVGTSLNANNSLNFTAWEPEVGPSWCGLGSRCSCLSPITATHHLLQRQKAMTGWQSIIFLSQTCGCIAA